MLLQCSVLQLPCLQRTAAAHVPAADAVSVALQVQQAKEQARLKVEKAEVSAAVLCCCVWHRATGGL